MLSKFKNPFKSNFNITEWLSRTFPITDKAKLEVIQAKLKNINTIDLEKKVREKQTKIQVEINKIDGEIKRQNDRLLSENTLTEESKNDIRKLIEVEETKKKDRQLDLENELLNYIIENSPQTDNGDLASILKSNRSEQNKNYKTIDDLLKGFNIVTDNDTRALIKQKLEEQKLYDKQKQIETKQLEKDNQNIVNAVKRLETERINKEYADLKKLNESSVNEKTQLEEKFKNEQKKRQDNDTTILLKISAKKSFIDELNGPNTNVVELMNNPSNNNNFYIETVMIKNDIYDEPYLENISKNQSLYSIQQKYGQTTVVKKTGGNKSKTPRYKTVLRKTRRKYM